MERLIADANEYGKATGQASNLTIDSFSDIVTAIDLIQQKQNIAGTTAKEASSTVSGSLGMLKSSWDNLVTGMANPDADIGALVTQMTDSAQTAFGNLLPVAERALAGIGTAVTVLIPVAFEKIPQLIMDFAPGLINSVGTLISTLGGSFAQYAPVMIEAGVGLLNQLSSGVASGIPAFLESALPMLVDFSEGLREGAGTLVDAGLNLIENIAQGLADGLPAMIANIPTIVENIAGIVNDNAPKVLGSGLKIIATLGIGIIKAVPALIANFPKILSAILAVWSAFNWLSLGQNAITAIKNGVSRLAKQIPSALKSIGNNAINLFRGINWGSAGSNVIKLLVRGIKGLAKQVPNALKSIARSGFNAFKGIKWSSIGTNIIKGIASGLKGAGGIIVNAAKNAAKSAFNAAKNFLEIKSPSRLFRDQVGKMMALGLGIGFEENIPVSDMVDSLSDAVGDLEDFESPTITPDVLDTSRAVQSFYVPDRIPAVANGYDFGYNGNNENAIESRIVGLLTELVDAVRENTGNPIYLDTGTLVGQMAPAFERKIGRETNYRRRGIK